MGEVRNGSVPGQDVARDRTVPARPQGALRAGEDGQSLVEIALALPLLLLLVLGVVDAGRVFYYTSAIANAAHVGAAYAAGHADTATAATVAARVCNETGFAGYSATPTCTDLSTTSTFGQGQDAVVTVTYAFRPVSAYVASRLFPVGPLRLRATATFPGLQ